MEWYKHTTHAFFETKAQQLAFHKEVKFSGIELTRSQYRELRTKHGGHHTPQHNYFHHEVSFKGHGGDSRVVTQGRHNDQAKLHKSGGQVISSEHLERVRGQTATITHRMGV